MIKPARPNVRAFLTKVRAVIKANPQATPGHLMAHLNPLIRGWANYHRHSVSQRTFTSVDHAVFKMVWRWAKHRHPRKPKAWLKETYFRTKDGRHWDFFGEISGQGGKLRSISLVQASKVPIQRHIKVKQQANPYDPAWEGYFEHRLGLKMAATLKGKRSLLYLWQEQNGLCPVCGQKITALTGWHNHHLVWRSQGGGENPENRVLLHPTCHQQVHSQGLTVVKPRPARGVGKA